MPKAPPKSHSHSASMTTAAAPYTLPPISNTGTVHPTLYISNTPAYPYPPHHYPGFYFPPPLNSTPSPGTLPPIYPPVDPAVTGSMPIPQTVVQNPAASASPTMDTPDIPTTAAPGPAPKPKRVTKNNEDPLPWLEIKLDGEDDGAVPVYDSCNEIRRKIRAFFNSGIKCTQKRFLEVIGNVNCNSYRRFMALKGEGSGAENGTFYGAYIFFEKKRIFEGKPKGKKRLESERDYPNGRPLQDDARHRYYWSGPGLPPMTQKQIRMSVARSGY